jgi:hypothetical protein
MESVAERVYPQRTASNGRTSQGYSRDTSILYRSWELLIWHPVEAWMDRYTQKSFFADMDWTKPADNV